MGRARAAGVVLLALVVVGCTPSSSEPPNPTLTPALPTPTEDETERQQRLDFEAAEKSYRDFRAEYRRVLAAGGAKSATSVMKETAGGDYLQAFVPIIEGYKKRGWKEKGPETIVYVRNDAHFESAVRISVCEDGRKHATYDDRGKLVGRGELRTATLRVEKTAGVWRVWSGDGKKVSSC